MLYNKEAIYDQQINPLMAQILKICSENGVQMLASFALMDADPHYNDEPMLCTSSTTGDTWNSPDLLAAKRAIFNPSPTLTAAVTITTL